MVFVCEHCHFELEAAAKPCQCPGLRETEPNSHSDLKRKQGIPGSEAGGCLAGFHSCLGWLKAQLDTLNLSA